MLAALLACACPTFGDMEVVAADNTATPEVIDEVEAALADFAAWTGDAGVCVPEIEVQEDIFEPSWADAESEATGRYEGPHHAIQLASTSQSPRLDTLHELCHAKDRLEGHADAVDWPEPDDVADIPEGRRARESFAEACEGGPVDPTVDDTIAAVCGTEPVYDDADRYLANVVFPAAPRVAMSGAVDLVESVRAWEGLPDRAWVEDAVAVDGRVALLYVSGDPGDAYIEVLDSDLVTVSTRIQLLEDAWWSDVRIVPSDVGLYVRVDLYESLSGHLDGLLEVDPDTGTVRWVPSSASAPRDAVVSDGVVYAASEGHFSARSLTGQEVPLTMPGDLFGADVEPVAIWPEPNGFGFYTAAGLGRYDALADAWSLELAPPNVTRRVDLGDARALVEATWEDTARLYLYADGAYTPAGDLCASSPLRRWHSYNAMVGIAGRLDVFDYELDGADVAYLLEELSLSD